MLNSHTLDTIEERKGDHIMDYKIKGDSDCPIVEINLQNNETIKIERGSMAYMSNVTIEGKMNSNKKGLGGVLGAIGRSLTSGESMFITEATGTSYDGLLGIAPSIPGSVIWRNRWIFCDAYIWSRRPFDQCVWGYHGNQCG